MPDNKLDRLTRLRSKCTGETHAQARLRLLELGIASPPIPAPDQACQAQLEWWLLFLSAWPNSLAARPLGFERVVPRPDGLELQVERSSDRLEDLVRCLLPSVFEEEIGGIPGLRIRQDANGAPVLGLAGTTAQVTLLGVSAREWRAAVEERRRQLLDVGAEVLWDSSAQAMSSTEHELLNWFDADQGDAPYRFSSALLRRIGAFGAGGLPVCVTGWITGGPVRNSWKFEVEYLPEAGICYEEVPALLTDPEVGLPRTSVARSSMGREGGWALLVAGGDLLGSVRLLLHACDPLTVAAWERRWPSTVSKVRASSRIS